MKYAIRKRAEKHSFRLKFGSIIAIVVCIVVLVFVYFHLHAQTTKTTDPAASVARNDNIKNAFGTYLFSGTIMLGRAVETYANGDYNQPFSQLSTLGNYDARIGILECPVTDQNVSYQTQVSSLKFNCKPAWLPYLKKYYPIINVSSNHMYDMGEDGFSETVSRLKTAGFQVVGNYNPHIENDDCKSVILPVHVQKLDGTQVSGSLPIALCSYNYKELFSPSPGEIESIHKWSQTMPVVALLNGGPEYEHAAGAAQVSNAHKMIDQGADFVIGNGTHWAQNTEVYKGKLIVYSMGNFIFDQYDTDGKLALNMSVRMDVPPGNNIDGWLRVGDHCKTNPASCLALIDSQKIGAVKPTFTFKVVGSDGGYLTIAHRADSGQQRYLEQRANWADSEKLLGQ